MGEDETKAKKFWRGLRPTIYMRMTTTRSRTFTAIVEIVRLIKHDCDELAKSRDKGVKRSQPTGLKRAEYPNRTGMTKMPIQIKVRALCQKRGKIHFGRCFRELMLTKHAV